MPTVYKTAGTPPNKMENLTTAESITALAVQIGAIGRELHDFREKVVGNGQEGRIQRNERMAKEQENRLRDIEVNGPTILRTEITWIEAQIEE
jgi:hypothetical protein